MVLKKYVDPNEKVEADNGYKGESGNVLLPTDPSFINPEEDDARMTHDHYRMKERVRARHETINGRFKMWNILNDRYRHDIHRHANVMRAIAVITQIEIENGYELFSVKYDAEEAQNNTLTREPRGKPRRR